MHPEKEARDQDVKLGAASIIQVGWDPRPTSAPQYAWFIAGTIVSTLKLLLSKKKKKNVKP